MAADIDHAKIVQALTESHEKRLLNILKQLEEQVASLVMSAPTSDKQLFDLKWAIDARADLERIMRDTYLTEVDSQVRDYDQIVASMETMLNDYTDYTGLDPEIVSQLKRVSFQGFEDIASTFSNDLAEELYQSTLTGRDMAESVRNMRQKINGVYIASDDAEIERLVELAQAGDESAVRELHQKYAADRAGNNMRRYARQMVFDSAMQFDASINVAAGKDIGADRWKYYGSVITDTRAWCAKHAGKVLSEDYIRTEWPKNNWKGKADGDPFIVRGGYNCRHHFHPAFDFEDITEPKEEAPAPKKVAKKVETKSAIEKRLTASLAIAASDPRYVVDPSLDVPFARYRPDSMKSGEGSFAALNRIVGKAKFPSKMTSEGAAVVADSLDELNQIADQYNLPRVRAISSVGRRKAAASMGDGVLSVDAEHFNRYGIALSTPREELTAKLAVIKDRVISEKADVDSYFKAYNAAGSPEERAIIRDQYNAAVAKFNKTADEGNELFKVEQVINKPISTWKLGDNVKEAPFTIEGYFLDVKDKSRATPIHEFGHQIHQQFGVDGDLDALRNPPIEKWLRANRSVLKPNSRYGATDPEELFAESFAAYKLGRKDIVDPKLIELFDALETGDHSNVWRILER